MNSNNRKSAYDKPKQNKSVEIEKRNTHMSSYNEYKTPLSKGMTNIKKNPLLKGKIKIII